MLAALRCDKFSEACSTAHCDSDVPAYFATELLLWPEKSPIRLNRQHHNFLKISTGILLPNVASFALKL